MGNENNMEIVIILIAKWNMYSRDDYRRRQIPCENKNTVSSITLRYLSGIRYLQNVISNIL